jgi:uncharacterized protein with HEPN domain
MTDIESVKNAQRLHHILQAVQRIHRSVGELSYEMFMADEDKQGNVVRCLEIIGEAANHVSEEICAANPEIPWAAIIGMRNNLIHGYNEVNYSLVWATVQNDLKVLEERIPQIIGSLNMPPDFKFDQSADENDNFDYTMGNSEAGKDNVYFVAYTPSMITLDDDHNTINATAKTLVSGYTDTGTEPNPFYTLTTSYVSYVSAD